MNWKAIAPQTRRNLARDRFGEALRIHDLTDEEIAEEMAVYDQLKGGKRETQ